MAKYSPYTFTDGLTNDVTAARLNALGAGVREASMGRSTTFPTSPVDGDIHVYPADTTNGVMWMFMYRSSPNDWEFIGGSPLSHEILTSEGRNNATYGDLATGGPTITLPAIACDWDVEFGCHITMPTSAAERGRAAVKRGAAAISDNDCVAYAAPSSGSGQDVTAARQIRMTGLAASAVLLMQYRNDAAAGTVLYARRWLKAKPVRYTP